MKKRLAVQLFQIEKSWQKLFSGETGIDALKSDFDPAYCLMNWTCSCSWISGFCNLMVLAEAVNKFQVLVKRLNGLSVPRSILMALVDEDP